MTIRCVEKSNENSVVKPSIFSRISCIFVIVNIFLRIILMIFLKADNSLNVLFFSGWIKVGDKHSGIFNF